MPKQTTGIGITVAELRSPRYFTECPYCEPVILNSAPTNDKQRRLLTSISLAIDRRTSKSAYCHVLPRQIHCVISYEERNKTPCPTVRPSMGS